MSLAELEQRMAAEAKLQALQAHRLQLKQSSRQFRIPGKLIGLVVLLGVPAGMLWLVNLPYPPIRQPMLKAAPMLLLPSYMGMDRDFRLALNAVEQAKQYIDNATSPADVDRGAEQLAIAHKYLDALPSGWIDGRYDYYRWYGWYDWRLSPAGFNQARADLARMEAKVFQERNAQNQLAEADQNISTAKTQYQQAKSLMDKQQAIALWRQALDPLELIPMETLAGATARQRLDANRRELQQIAGETLNNTQTISLIEAARQFAWQAAKLGQNPPHAVQEWEQVGSLWQQAIDRLAQVSIADPAGYTEAQKLMAQYRLSLAQIKIRQSAETDSVQALEHAQRQIQSLTSSVPSRGTIPSNYVISQLQGIIHELEQVQPGTTAYLEAQELLLAAKNKLNHLQ
jgi:hypothetical protein